MSHPKSTRKHSSPENHAQRVCLTQRACGRPHRLWRTQRLSQLPRGPCLRCGPSGTLADIQTASAARGTSPVAWCGVDAMRSFPRMPRVRGTSILRVCGWAIPRRSPRPACTHKYAQGRSARLQPTNLFELACRGLRGIPKQCFIPAAAVHAAFALIHKIWGGHSHWFSHSGGLASALVPVVSLSRLGVLDRRPHCFGGLGFLRNRHLGWLPWLKEREWQISIWDAHGPEPREALRVCMCE